MLKSIVGACLMAAFSCTASAQATFSAGASDTLAGTFDSSNVTWASETVDYTIIGLSGNAYVSYTFLGSEAGYTDFFVETVSGTQFFKNKGYSAVGSSFTVVDTVPQMDFKFTGTDFLSNTITVMNGDVFASGANPSWGILRGATSSVGTFDFIMGFNDQHQGDSDFDDMIVGVTVTAVPEPSTYALMLAGLAATTFVARRRRQTKI